MVTSRIWFTAAQKAELWERWKNGQSAAAISRALERKNKTGVERIVVLHGGLRRSLTWDQGKEMHAHKRFTVATNVQVYFRDPRSPWQRGSNENANGLLRQYLPRGTDFSRISQSYLNAIALRLNQRPRKTLGFQTPADRLQAVLH